MKILYDHQAFTGKLYGGVARYFYDLMEQLRKQNADVRFPSIYTNNMYLKEGSWLQARPHGYPLGKRYTNLGISQLNRLKSILALKRGDFDVFHPTFFHPYFLKHIGSKPFVITYHDVIKEKLNFPSLDNASFELKQEMLQRASRVIAVSECTKRDLVEIFGLPAEKITVVHHGSRFANWQPAEVDFSPPLPRQFLLYVGERAFYKNFPAYVAAIGPLFRQYPDLQLICAGGGAFTPEEQALFTSLGLESRIRFQKIASDDQLGQLYRAATAFVYPSLYEGFGIPILEAFAMKCPVLLSRASCFPEVAGEAAAYFDPTNARSMLNATAGLLADGLLQQQLIERGTTQLANYSLQKTAQQTLAVYRQVCATNS